MTEEISKDIYDYVTNNKLTPTEALLYLIFTTLKDMKTQEKEYWETWKQNKEKENNGIQY